MFKVMFTGKYYLTILCPSQTKCLIYNTDPQLRNFPEAVQWAAQCREFLFRMAWLEELFGHTSLLTPHQCRFKVGTWYWTSEACGQDQAYAFTFTPEGQPKFSLYPQSTKLNVRLVRYLPLG